MRARGCLSLAAIAILATAGGRVDARDEPQVHRLVRVYDWTSGFPWSYVGSVAQDRRGFLWVTTTSGFYRFDGKRAHRVDLGDYGYLAHGSTEAGRVVVFTASGRCFEATTEGFVALDDGSGGSAVGSVLAAVASDGTLWRVREGVVERLGHGSRWIPVSVPSTSGDPPWRVYAGRAGRMYLSSRTKVWVVEPIDAVREIAAIDRVLGVLEKADGTVIVAANQAPGPVTSRVFEVAGGRSRPIYEERGARLIGLAQRGDTLWVAMDSGLQALGPGFVPRDRLTAPVIPATGPLIVDHEGSLWMATYRGLVQIPEPDVCAVAPARFSVTRDIARTTHGVWGTFWGAMAFFFDGPGGLRLTQGAEPHWAPFCRDGADRVWTAGQGGHIVALGSNGAVGPILSEQWSLHGCGEGADGRRWIASSQDLWVIGAEDASPRLVRIHLDGGEGISFAAEAADGTLWLARGARMCGASAADVLAGTQVHWRCEEIPDGHDVVDLQSMPSGDVWAITSSPSSIRSRSGGRWSVIRGSEQLTSRWVTSITPSPSGGVWLSGQGVIVRVGERLDLPEGWEILEQPTAWNGLISINVVGVEEESDGTLWLGTDIGVQRIPPEIRKRRAAPPAVEFVEGSINGEPLDPGKPLDLPYRRNRLETHFAALTYRDPCAVRYRMRLHDDDPWSPPTADGRFTFVNLAPGAYALQVVASLDGSRWSRPGARLEFRVRLPWYARPWFIGGAALVVFGAGHIGFRLRARRRLAREKQRTRIAMDLHDEVGSGLGTIAVLAGIAGRSDLSEERRADVTGRIAAVSQELARSLGDIVWSLRTSSGSLDALWNQLLERARPLFSSGAPRATFEAPDPVPDEALSLVLRRNLHLVAYEALHNAARHSGATTVALRLVRDGSGWRLEVEDDGRGLGAGPAAASVRRGLGIEAMKARVAEMQGTITWDRGALGGTRVTVRFHTGEG